MWGYSSSINGLSRTYGQAIRKYAQTGFKSYVILHFGNPSARVPMISKRLNGVEEYCTLRSEYAEVYGNYYGVTKEQIDKNLEIGLDVIVKVDVQGFFTLKNLFPDAISIFWKFIHQ